MAQPVNFDNAATTFPKPPEVYAAVSYALEKQGGNPGRGGHPLSMAAGEAVYAARETVGNFFGAQPENVIFTSNCTHALNLAIQGVARRGGHFIISDLEHNSVARPVEALARAGKITYSVAHVYPEDARTVESFRSLITPRTQAMVFTLASNVTGQVLPWRALAKLCREWGICCIGDGAQVCGILPVTLEDGFHILCTAGHKGLYGAPGTGLLMTDGSVKIRPLMQGALAAPLWICPNRIFCRMRWKAVRSIPLGQRPCGQASAFCSGWVWNGFMLMKADCANGFRRDLRGFPVR